MGSNGIDAAGDRCQGFSQAPARSDRLPKTSAADNTSTREHSSAAGSMADVFISFKTDDTPRVQAVHDGFRARGLTVFWSNDIPKGAPNYQAVIKDEILKAPVVVVVWTAGSVHSGPVVQECSQAEKASKLFQILFDFSAYSDLAIGFARLLGIRVPENFSYPYLASNIREFWNRWHITLSQWVRDYLFVPTGRWLFSTPLRPYPAAIAAVSYLVTFLVVGAWHGLTAAFLAWGLYHGALLAAHHVIQARMPMVIASSTWYRSWIGTAIGCVVTFLCVTIGWIPFITDLDRTGQLLRLMLLGAK